MSGVSRLYFDNAATSYPKPPGVPRAVLEHFEGLHGNAGRGSYREALECQHLLRLCRTTLAGLFQCGPADHVIFALNGTDALNLAIKGVVRPGGHVVTTCLDHNSVLRPLSAMQEQQGVAWTAVEVHPATTRLDPARLAAAIRPSTQLVVVNHASNVTGVLQPLEDVAAVCHERGVPLLVDAAQSAGHVPIDFAGLGLDLLACPGHKGLMGPLGTGVLVIRAELVERMRTVREGGTGSASEDYHQPHALPDRFEAGSHNAPGLAGLLAGVQWIAERGVAVLRSQEAVLCELMCERLAALDRLTWWGPRAARERVGVFSVRIDGFEPADLAMVLEADFGVLCRSGLHCAPLAHRAIGTLERGGTTRLSLGAFTTVSDVEAAARALAAIAAGTSVDRGRSVPAGTGQHAHD